MNAVMRDGGERVTQQARARPDLDEVTAIVRRVLECGGAMLIAYDVYPDAQTEQSVLVDALAIMSPDQVARREMLIETPQVGDYTAAELVIIGTARFILGTPGGIEAVGTIGCERIREQLRARQQQAMQELIVTGRQS